ncbi:MAG: hypothetical protein ACTSRZ_18500 [Promethearchaeota archaeon]
MSDEKITPEELEEGKKKLAKVDEAELKKKEEEKKKKLEELKKVEEQVKAKLKEKGIEE